MRWTRKTYLVLVLNLIVVSFTNAKKHTNPPSLQNIANFRTNRSGLETAIRVMGLTADPNTDHRAYGPGPEAPSAVHRAYGPDSVDKMRMRAARRIDQPIATNKAIPAEGRTFFEYLRYPRDLSPENVMMLLQHLGKLTFKHYPPNGFESPRVYEHLWNKIPYDSHGIKTASTVGEHTIRFMTCWQICENLNVLPYDTFYLLSPSIKTYQLHREDMIAPYFELLIRYHANT